MWTSRERLVAAGDVVGVRRRRSRDSRGHALLFDARTEGTLMARVLYFDCFSGAAGDMLLGALLDAGLPLEALREALGSLGVGHELRVSGSCAPACRRRTSQVVEAGHGRARAHARALATHTQPEHTHHHHDHQHAHHHDIARTPARASLARRDRASDRSLRAVGRRQGARGRAVSPAGRGRSGDPPDAGRARSTCTKSAPSTRSSTSSARCSRSSGSASTTSSRRRSTSAAARSRSRTDVSRCRRRRRARLLTGVPIYAAASRRSW